ncbi:hypothetical protein [Mycoplasma parvum]|uniref:Uncharacterized protein n=1 Tax=Mycoplasma parvum str. Indiana TaxID=1403316 RepID=U5NBV2_9MOLU|nr:hypothetical protein [Mycoplasma parvum]AGX89046.1 hypothetical protein PRV_01435 [Mycoplasma parvum str. Indiana]
MKRYLNTEQSKFFNFLSKTQLYWEPKSIKSKSLLSILIELSIVSYF